MKETILKPVITEKSLAGGTKSFYTFIVHPDVNKQQIKQAVQRIFSVKVDTVRIVNIKPKTKRRGRRVGTTSMRKKAIVKLMTDQKIDFFDKL